MDGLGEAAGWACILTVNRSGSLPLKGDVSAIGRLCDVGRKRQYGVDVVDLRRQHHHAVEPHATPAHSGSPDCSAASIRSSSGYAGKPLR